MCLSLLCTVLTSSTLMIRPESHDTAKRPPPPLLTSLYTAKAIEMANCSRIPHVRKEFRMSPTSAASTRVKSGQPVHRHHPHTLPLTAFNCAMRPTCLAKSGNYYHHCPPNVLAQLSSGNLVSPAFFKASLANGAHCCAVECSCTCSDAHSKTSCVHFARVVTRPAALAPAEVILQIRLLFAANRSSFSAHIGQGSLSMQAAEHVPARQLGNLHSHVSISSLSTVAERDPPACPWRGHAAAEPPATRRRHRAGSGR